MRILLPCLLVSMILVELNRRTLADDGVLGAQQASFGGRAIDDTARGTQHLSQEQVTTSAQSPWQDNGKTSGSLDRARGLPSSPAAHAPPLYSFASYAPNNSRANTMYLQAEARHPMRTASSFVTPSTAARPAGFDAYSSSPLGTDEALLMSQGSCDDGGCSMPCPDCSQSADCSCEAPRCRRGCLNGFGIFAEYLLWRPRNFDITYASEVDGPDNAPPPQGIQVGPMATVAPGYSSGYRIGIFWMLQNRCAQIDAVFTDFSSHETDSISRDADDTVIRPLVTHPLIENAASDWDDAGATHDIDLQLADFDVQWQIARCATPAVGVLLGARFAHLQQDFRSQFNGLGYRFVNTDVDFDGGGIRLGLNLDHYSPCHGWMVYGRGAASFLVGEFKGSYLQGSDADPIEVQTTWDATQIVPVLELEVGIRWRSPGERLLLHAGYQAGAWFNVVPTDEFITAVALNNFDEVTETVLFDGLNAAATVRF